MSGGGVLVGEGRGRGGLLARSEALFLRIDLGLAAGTRSQRQHHTERPVQSWDSFSPGTRARGLPRGGAVSGDWARDESVGEVREGWWDLGGDSGWGGICSASDLEEEELAVLCDGGLDWRGGMRGVGGDKLPGLTSGLTWLDQPGVDQPAATQEEAAPRTSPPRRRGRDIIQGYHFLSYSPPSLLTQTYHASPSPSNPTTPHDNPPPSSPSSAS